MIRRQRHVVRALVLVLISAQLAGAASVVLDVEVPAARWKAARLKNLPRGALVQVQVEATGEIRVAFIDQRALRQAPEVTATLFHGRSDGSLSFSVGIPAAGDYYLLLDNRASSSARTVKVNVRATASAREGAAEVTLTSFQASLERLFVMEPFPIRVKKCGTPTAFAGPAGIVLCAEYAERLQNVLGDAAKASDALLFTLFHELGHVLLAQWKYPFFDNEEVADEFATALMVMTGQKERVRAKAEFFAANPSAAEAIAKIYRDDRHPISAQRARNIMRWAQDRNLVRKWQPVFVPHMQTPILERLLAQSPPWLERELVEKELAGRQ